METVPTELNKTVENENRNKLNKPVSSEKSEKENFDKNIPKFQNTETINSEEKCKKRLKIQAKVIIEIKASTIGKAKEQT